MADDNGSQNDDTTTDDAKGGDDTSNVDKSTQDSSQDAKDTSKGDADVVSREELDKVIARMTAADRRASAAEEENKKLKLKDATELEKAQAALKDEQEKAEKLSASLRERALENAFLASNKHTWHDPQDALRLLDMDGVEIDEDGKVKGMDSAIEKLAKKKPHLVKPDDKSGDDDKDDDSSAASGSPRNGRRAGDKNNKPDVKKLAKRFPALQTR